MHRGRFAIPSRSTAVLIVGALVLWTSTAFAQQNNPFSQIFGAIVRGAQQQNARDGWMRIDPAVRDCVQQTLTANYRRLITVEGLVSQGIGPDNSSVALDVQACTQRIVTLRQQAQAAAAAREEAARQAAQQAAEEQQRQQEEETRRAAEEQRHELAEKRQREEEERQAAEAQHARVKEALQILGFYKSRTTISPSFDCAKAKAPIEQLICSDHRLADADREMGEAILAHKSDAHVIHEQRAWLKDRAVKCGVPKSVSAISDVQRRKIDACLTERTESRVAALSGGVSGSADLEAREAIFAYQKSINAVPTGTLSPAEQAQLIAKAAEAKNRQQREGHIAAERTAWQTFLAKSAPATKLTQGDPDDLIVFLNTGTQRYRSGQVALTLDGNLNATVPLSVTALGTAAGTLHNKDGATVAAHSLQTHGVNVDLASISYPTPSDKFVGDTDILILQRSSLVEFPFLGVMGARAELIAALEGSQLTPLLTIQHNDVVQARAQRIAGEQAAKQQLEQQRAAAQKRAQEMARKSEQIRTGLANGTIADFGLITIDGRSPILMCAPSSSDLDVLAAFDGLPETLIHLPRRAIGNDDQVFLAIRRGDCSALIAKGADLQKVMAGLYRDRVVFSIYPETVPLGAAAAKLATIAKQEDEERKRNEAQRAQLVAAQQEAAKADAELRKSQDALIPKCDDTETRDALAGAIKHNAFSNIATLRLLDLSNAIELSFDPQKPERRCTATFTLNTGEERDSYRIWLASDKTHFIVQVEK